MKSTADSSSLIGSVLTSAIDDDDGGDDDGRDDDNGDDDETGGVIAIFVFGVVLLVALVGEESVIGLKEVSTIGVIGDAQILSVSGTAVSEFFETIEHEAEGSMLAEVLVTGIIDEDVIAGDELCFRLVEVSIVGVINEEVIAHDEEVFGLVKVLVTSVVNEDEDKDGFGLVNVLITGVTRDEGIAHEEEGFVLMEVSVTGVFKDGSISFVCVILVATEPNAFGGFIA